MNIILEKSCFCPNGISRQKEVGDWILKSIQHFYVDIE